MAGDFYCSKDSPVGKQLTVDHLQDQLDRLRSHVAGLKTLVLALSARVDMMGGVVEVDPRKIRADGRPIERDKDKKLDIYTSGSIFASAMSGTHVRNPECTPYSND